MDIYKNVLVEGMVFILLSLLVYAFILMDCIIQHLPVKVFVGNTIFLLIFLMSEALLFYSQFWLVDINFLKFHG